MIIGGEEPVAIGASPNTRWSIVADVTRMGERSPEIVRAHWLGEARATVGAHFKGCNRLTLYRLTCTG
jgi:hypothetical protein